MGGFVNISTRTTVKESILKSLGDLKKPFTSKEVYEHIIQKKYYVGNSKTPDSTVSAIIGEFITKNDTRVNRIKGNGNYYLYYLAEYEQEINIDDISQQTRITQDVDYQERDLHTLLSTYLKSKNIFTKTIFHEKSKNSKDKNQKWIHPDIIGVEFLDLTSDSCDSHLVSDSEVEKYCKEKTYLLKKN